MVEYNRKAKHLCLNAKVRPYCKVIYFYIISESKEISKRMILQDAIAALLQMEKEFNSLIGIDAKFVKAISYYKKTFKVENKNTGEVFKIETECENVPVREWEETEKLMESRCHVSASA